MKNRVYILMVLAVWACKNPTDRTAVTEVDRSFLSLGVFAGYTDSFTIQSNMGWKLAVEPASSNNWMQVSATEGAAGKTTVKVLVLVAAVKTQTATIIVTNAGNYSDSISVTQKVYTAAWNKTFGGNGDDRLNSIITTADGGYLLAGHTWTNNNGDIGPCQGFFDMLIVKLGASGNKEWVTTIGGNAFEEINAVLTTADGGYMAVGYTDSDADEKTGTDANGLSDMLIVKLDASGRWQWSKRYGGSGNEMGNSIVTTVDGGIVVAGNTSSGQSIGGEIVETKGGADVWVMKLDASGNNVWSKTYGSNGDEYAASIKTTTDGGFVLLAQTGSGEGDDVPAGHANDDIWLLKLDGSGNLQWSKRYGGSGFDSGGDIAVTAAGDFIITAQTNSTDGDVPPNNDGIDAWVLKINAEGSKLWSKVFKGDDVDVANKIAVNTDGSFFVAGYTRSNNNGEVPAINGESDLWLLKLDAAGNKLWVKTIGGDQHEFGSCINILANGSFVLGGATKSNNSGDVPATKGDYDIWVVKFN